MCLIVFAWDSVPEYRLVLGANRDEFHRRPSQELHWWPDRQDVLGGRDLLANGTWLAVSKKGRFATVTNYRENQRKRPDVRSRGELVTNFVYGTDTAESFVAGLEEDHYAGFSLLACDGNSLWYVSNRGDDPTPLAPGIYGLSNASLDTPWPKLERTRNAMANLIKEDSVNESEVFQVLSDRTTVPASEVETDTLPFELARAVSAPFIVTPDYGTRCTTVVTWSNEDRIRVAEHRFDEAGERTGKSRFSFAVAS